jgi:ankyrin repeat protein
LRTRPNKKNKEGYTALHSAVFCRQNVEIIRTFLESPIVDPTIPDGNGDTPLHLVLRGQSIKRYTKIIIAGLLISKMPSLLTVVNKTKESPLDILSNQKEAKLANDLILWNICKDDYTEPENPLHWAARKEDLPAEGMEIIQALVSKFPDWLNEINRKGVTPLRAAVLAGNLPILAMLLKGHSNHTIKLPDGNTPDGNTPDGHKESGCRY